MSGCPRKPRIAVVMGGHFSASIGGSQYQAHCLVQELVKRNEFEVFYLARHFDREYRPQGYELREVICPGRLRRYGLIFDIPSLVRMLRDVRPDVIYQRGLKAYTGVAAKYAQRKNCTFVFHVASDYDVVLGGWREVSKVSLGAPLRRLDTAIGHYGIRKADHVVAQSITQAQLVERNFGRRVTAVVRNFHPPPAEIIEKEDSPILVVWVANFKPVKRPELFVRLAHDLRRDRNAKFIMIGRGGPDSVYGELRERIVGMRNLEYLGERPIEEVNATLARAHVLVNTSVAEGFPNTFIQAWMRKVPVATVSVNPDDVFGDEIIGFCGRTYEGMRDKVIKLVNDERLKRDMGEKAQSFAFKEHSLGNANALLALFKEAASE